MYIAYSSCPANKTERDSKEQSYREQLKSGGSNDCFHRQRKRIIYKIFPGEEDTTLDGHGRLAEFTEDGALVAVWDDAGKLSAPWGIALAPTNFAAYSGQLLVGNFGSGKIAAFDPAIRRFSGYLQNDKGTALVIEKLWGILFGNGTSLGDSDALYFASGPDDEKDGIFGVIRTQK